MTAPEPGPVSGSMNEWARAYTGLGWRLVKLRPRSKVPMLVAWQNAAIGAEDVDAMFTDEHHGMGIVHGHSGTGAFDVDSVEWARAVLEEFGIDFNAMMSGYPRISGKDGRDKILFRLPQGMRTHKLVWPAPPGSDKPVVVFELRGDGGQDVLPPSIHPDTGRPYAWVVSPFDLKDGVPMAPRELLAIWQDWAAFEPQLKSACPWAPATTAPPPVRRQCSSKSTGVIDAYNRAVNIEEALAKAGYKQRGKRWLAPSSSSGIPGVVVLPDSGRCYSHHASDVLNDGHSHDAFDLLVLFRHGGNLSEAVRDAAAMLDMADAPTIDLSGITHSDGKRKRTRQTPPAEPRNPPARPPMPEDLLYPPGVMSTYVDYATSTAVMPCRELAVLSAIVLFGLALGRRVESVSGLRTNIYGIAVGRTGRGKDHPRKANKLILSMAGLEDRIGGEEIASGQGLLSRVAMNPAVLFQIDEFGLFLQSVQNPSAGSHKAEITNALLKLFSAASSTLHGTEYADQKARPRIDIEYPCVALYGTTTPDTLFPALGSQHLASGYLNRMLVAFADDDADVRKNRRARLVEPPRELVEWIRHASQLSDPDAELVGCSPASPITIGESDAAAAILEEFDWFCDARMASGAMMGTGDLWARAYEHAAKVSLIAQLSMNITSREISEQAARWGTAYVRHLTERLEIEVSDRVADSDFMRIAQDVLRVVKRGSERGMTQNEVVQRCRPFKALKPIERDQVITALVRDREVRWMNIVQHTRSGRPRHAMVAWEFLPEDQRDDD